MNPSRFLRLKEQILAEDPNGLEFVFEQTRRYCIRTLMKKTRCDEPDAEDIYMDAILIFRENIISGKLTVLSNLQTYVFGICWNIWRDLNRARKKWKQEENEVERQLYLLVPPDGDLLALEEKEFVKSKIKQVIEALNELSPKCRELLNYVYIEQRPQKEIATLMKFASAGVVKVTRHRCYQQWIKKIENLKLPANGK